MACCQQRPAGVLATMLQYLCCGTHMLVCQRVAATFFSSKLLLQLQCLAQPLVAVSATAPPHPTKHTYTAALLLLSPGWQNQALGC
jgi:hypothetical protein